MKDEKPEKRQRKGAKRADAIEKAIPGLMIQRSSNGYPLWGGMCPWQADGYWQGNPCYFRFRHNTASMTVWKDEAWGEELFASTIMDYNGHPDDIHAGVIEPGGEQAIMVALIAKLSPVGEDNPSSKTQLGRAVDALVEMMREHEGVADDTHASPAAVHG